MLLICVLRDLFALSQLYHKKRKELVLEILFEDLVDLDMMMQGLGGVLDELVGRDSEDLLEVNEVPIHAEVRLGQLEQNHLWPEMTWVKVST